MTLTEAPVTPVPAGSRPRRRGWHPEGASFVWLDRTALDRIRASLEQGPAASATLVYIALQQAAFEARSGDFTSTITRLSQLASLGRRTVERRLADLELLGIVRVQRCSDPHTCGRLPNRYSLVRQTPAGPIPQRRSPLRPDDAAPATASGASAVATGNTREERGNPLGPPPRLDATHRISAERELVRLEREEAELRAETSEAWARDQFPDKVALLRRVRADIQRIRETLR